MGNVYYVLYVTCIEVNIICDSFIKYISYLTEYLHKRLNLIQDRNLDYCNIYVNTMYKTVSPTGGHVFRLYIYSFYSRALYLLTIALAMVVTNFRPTSIRGSGLFWTKAQIFAWYSLSMVK